mgnify:FL=1
MQNFVLRFIDSGPRSAVENMAVDEALAISAGQNRDFACLRFYRWRPYALSFGYNQSLEKLVDLNAVSDSGLGIVRRMSGGKMVFHADEHTFSLVLTLELIKDKCPEARTFLDMFRFAIEPLVHSLVDLGVPARFSSAREMSSGRGNHLHCYAAAAGHSVFAGQHKLIGAAGVFRNDCLIIHGSIPISIVSPPEKVFLSENRRDLTVKMASLNEFISDQNIQKLPAATAGHYAAALGCKLSESELNETEKQLAENLFPRYSSLDRPIGFE